MLYCQFVGDKPDNSHRYSQHQSLSLALWIEDRLAIV